MLTNEPRPAARTSQMLFRCYDEELKQLKAYSKEHGIPMSALCRQALRQAGVLNPA